MLCGDEQLKPKPAQERKSIFFGILQRPKDYIFRERVGQE